MIKQKKEQIKPALIMCAILGVIILVVFVAASNTNSKVVENMKGKVIFYGDGLKLYNFDDKELTELAGKNCFDGRFMDGGSIIYADCGENCLTEYDINDNRKIKSVKIPGGNIKGMDYSQSSGKAAAITEACGKYEIWIYDGENLENAKKLAESDNEIYDLSFSDNGNDVYYTENKGDGGILRSVSSSGGAVQNELESNGAKLFNVCVRGDFIYVSQENHEAVQVIKYAKKLGRASVLKFNSDRYSCTSIVTVSDEEYITTGNRDGKMSLYVCNGSNMRLIKETGEYDSLKVTGYYVNIDDKK